jgi:hypothetical protein
MPQDVIVPNNEDTVLQTAEIILDAVTLSQAIAEGGLDDARFQARLVAIKAESAGWQEVAGAARRVTYELRTGSTRPLNRDTLAMDELFLAIERAQGPLGQKPAPPG